MATDNDFKEAAKRVLDPKEINFDDVVEAFKMQPGYTDTFLKFLSAYDAMRKKQTLSAGDDGACNQLDAQQKQLLRTAPNGPIHGYLISLPPFNRKQEELALTYAVMNTYYQKDPSFFHQLTRKFVSEKSDEFFELRETLVIQSIFSDIVQLYISRAEALNPKSTDSVEWLEGVYTNLLQIISDIGIISPVIYRVKDRLVAIHKEVVVKT